MTFGKNSKEKEENYQTKFLNGVYCLNTLWIKNFDKITKYYPTFNHTMMWTLINYAGKFQPNPQSMLLLQDSL